MSKRIPDEERARIAAAIEANLAGAKLTTQRLARELGVSPTTLYVITRERTGRPSPSPHYDTGRAFVSRSKRTSLTICRRPLERANFKPGEELSIRAEPGRIVIERCG